MHAEVASRVRDLTMGFAAVLVLVTLVVLAVRADVAAPHASPWLVVLDVATGVTFVVASAVAPGSRTERVLIAAVGAAWLAASFLPAAGFHHQAVLVVALIAFPAGRVRGLRRWVLVGLAVPVAMGLLPQIAVAALFTLVALLSLVEDRRSTATAYPTAAAVAVAVALGASWSVARLRPEAFDPAMALVGYELVLLAVAVAFPVAARAVIRSRAKLADRLLAGERLVGLDGFAIVLGRALGDPNVQVLRWHSPDVGYVDEQSRPVPTGDGDRRWFTVDDPDGPVAVVAHHSPAFDDAPTAEAVATAVRLAVRNLRLQEEQQQQLRELEAARTRIVAAADRERARAATQLREDVGTSLQLAQSELRSVRAAAQDLAVVESLDTVVGELTAASRDIGELLAGVPPAQLGGGRLRAALDAVAQRSPVPVSVTIDADAAGDADTETAFFYVCSEALANAVKYADANRIDITVRRTGGAIVTTVSDDGQGGANPSGSGLQGLSDRLAARNGRLQVDSPPEAGTTVTAILPAS
jgi:signal transduction histidine kinase